MERSTIEIRFVKTFWSFKKKEFYLDCTSLGKLQGDYLEPFKEEIENKNQDIELIPNLVDTILVKEKENAWKYFEWACKM